MPLNWIARCKWRLLLAGILGLLVISPIARVFDQQDNFITPVFGAVLLAVILSAARGGVRIALLGAWVLWLFVSIATDGSGLFAGVSLVAPIIFLLLIAAIFVLLAQWMMRAGHINAEVLCAAICGYLLLGISWTVLYSIALTVRLNWFPSLPAAFLSAARSDFTVGDLLYFSFTTLTTTGYGDIAPRGSEVRMLAVVEAMVGLFYNTIIIARFVSLYGVRYNRE